MADQDTNTDTLPTPEQDSDNQPQVTTLLQYVKDLSAECPSAPAVFQWQSQPALDVQFGIASEKVADDVHEAGLKIEVKATSDEGTRFIVDLTYAGLFAFRNIPEDQLAPFLLVEGPRLLFPFARQIVSDAVQNMGFPPLLLEPIDFGAVFAAQMQAQAGQLAGAGEPPVGNA